MLTVNFELRRFQRIFYSIFLHFNIQFLYIKKDKKNKNKNKKPIKNIPLHTLRKTSLSQSLFSKMADLLSVYFPLFLPFLLWLSLTIPVVEPR